MKTRNAKLQRSTLNLAVQGALVTMFAMPFMAMAADDEVSVLTRPTSSIEVGVAGVSEKSAKFGEYNGLNDSGAYGIGNFNIGGGSAYDAYDGGNGTLRWDFSGRNLGTTSREVGASVSSQGSWDVSVAYDELRHNVSDSYQTPLQGSMGGNNFTLPSSFGAINGAAPSARVLSPTQLGAFHTEEVGTTRKNTSFGAGFHFSPQLSIRLEFNHLDQSGAKLIGSGAQGGITIGTSTGRAEAVNILMNPTNYTTDTLTLALNWVGDKGHLTAGYFGSIFRDGYNNVSWQNAMTTAASGCAGAACYTNNTMGTAPDNSFHQLNLSGGYAFSPSTKLVGGFSYGYNRQNEAYGPTSAALAAGGSYSMMQAGGLPQSSLDGSVITTHANVKLTTQTTKDLLLSAGFKYNERDNQTTSNTYRYFDLGGFGAGNQYTGVNTPYSSKKGQFELAGDYRLTKAQSLRIAYDHEYIKRWCNNVVGGAECVASPSSDEDKLGLTYRLKAGDSIKLNVGYAYSKRNAEFNHLYKANTGNYAVAATINGGDYAGYLAHPYSARTQNIVKAGVNWQATEKLDFGLSARYSLDEYEATLGVQDGSSASINLDATYSYSENGSVSAYAGWQNSERDLKAGATGGGASVTVPPVNVFSNQLKQDGASVGLNTKHAFMGGKLELLGDLSYSLDKSHYSTQVPYSATCGAAGTLTCGDTPDIKAELVAFKLTGSYKIDKHSKVALVYLYQSLRSNDYYYNAYLYGYTPNRVVPTNEQSPNYDVSFLGMSYAYSF
ncbi:MAG: MtrB/PioB family decaheme-associated outer membrane protein [Azonexaceae bacterium]|nr:MtrB/PioB family decaheme-associated outer membrane protein [Azonexaceae bacterium]